MGLRHRRRGAVCEVLPLNEPPRWFGDAANGGAPDLDRYEFLAGTSHIPGDAAPDLRNRTYTIATHVEIPDTCASGMLLLVHGDMASGYALCLRDGHLTHDHNFAGTHHVVTSPDLVPAGEHTLRFAFHAPGDHARVGARWIDGTQAGRVDMPATLRRLPQWSGLHIGRNPLVPVGDYPGGFPVTGNLDRVVVELGPAGGIDHAAHLASDLGAQRPCRPSGRHRAAYTPPILYQVLPYRAAERLVRPPARGRSGTPESSEARRRRSRRGPPALG